jgi:Leucine-rich repeat (LRR) protein
MTNVTLLDAGQNDLKDVPNILGFLPQLRSLQLDGNAIRAIRNPLLNDPSALKNFLRKRGPPPRGEGYLHDESSEYDSVPSTTPIPTNNAAKSLINSALVGTFTLDLSDKGLDSLPIEVGNELLLSNPSSGRDGDNGFVGERIHKLDVSNNKLSSLDDWLTAVPNITSLEASKNLIEFLPKFIGDVPLVELLISRNKLSSSALAATLIEGTASVMAANLTYLDLSGNRLKWMPTALSKLPVLSDLILINNTITTLASESHDEGIESGWPVEGFKSLENLNLADNKISELGNLPHCLATNCPAMKFLSLRNNELHVIPPILGLIETLTNIDLRGNPQRGIRMNVLERKAGDILSYLRGRIDDQDRVAVKTKSSSSDSNDNGKTSLSVIEANERIEGLRSSIQDITLQLNNVYITEAEKCAMKKKLHMNKANLIQEERCLRHAINGCS